MMKTAERLFLDFSCSKLEQLAGRIGVCLDRLDDGRIWQRDSENENAVGNLVLHLCGNVTQWIGHGVAGEPDIRTRDMEFAARGGPGVRELKEILAAAVKQAVSRLQSLPEEKLVAGTRVQNYEITVLEAIYHVVEHFSMHTGQIILATKLWTHEDMGFYRHLLESGGTDDGGKSGPARP
jgi:uncharacterized damage-inducible protein DinB